MGINQSIQIQPKSNLYDLLQVERNADLNEIRRAYKKQALRLHPDRNLGKEQEAATKFAKVLAAYEVLTDPQERAWYDQHDETAEYSEFSAKITKTPELQQYMDKAFLKTLNPEKDEFYRLATELFERLRNEELEAAFELGIAKEEVPTMEAPLFGHIDAEWSSQTKPFYNTWKSFSTLKSFSWEDVYPVHHAEDRRSRRMMETRNKRVRDAAKKEFNEAVRSLVNLVYTLDVRVKNQQKIQDRKHIKAQEKKPKKSGSSEARTGEYQQQQWARVDQQEVECIVCEMMFGSDAELAIHEETIEHGKLLKKLQQQMIEEDIKMNPRKEPKHQGKADEAGDEVSELAAGTTALSVEDIMSQMDSHKKCKKTSSITIQPKEKQKKAKKRKQQRLDSQEAALKCFTCQTIFGHRNDLLEHCKISKHAPPIFR